MAQVSRGAIGEVLAARFLRDKKWKIITANYRCRFGEIDIIAQDKSYIVFVEVKTRSVGAWVTPAEAVTSSKQRKIIQTAGLFLQNHTTKLQPRFDVIEVWTEKDDPLSLVEINHIVGAYETEGLHAAF